VQRRPFLPVCLLLLLGETPGHGYELTERLREWGFSLTGPGPVYRELRILEEGGLAHSSWSETQSGPVPRVYELTAEGRTALDDAAHALDGLAELLQEFHRRHERLPGPPAAPRQSPRRRGR